MTVKMLARLPEVIKVETPTGVRVFFELVAEVVGMGFHPDTRFGDYVGLELSADEAGRLDRMMDGAFIVCIRERLDPYEMAVAAVAKVTSDAA